MDMEITPEIVGRIKQLDEKYQAMGQDMVSYLDGLLYMDYLKYWDYVHTDTLLSLQNPRTNFPDEKIFIMYHQITELFFKLCIHEFEQIATEEKLDLKFLMTKLKRIASYFDGLITTYDIMVDGMDKEQFLKFRMALLPASGFQSAQYRKIEIYSTDFINLVHKDKRMGYTGQEEIGTLFEDVYWKEGATEAATGAKTLTLVEFEERYKDEFIALGKE